MKIKCYDKYRKQWLIIEPADDHIDITSSSSNYSSSQIYMYFTCDSNHKDSCEDPHPERWSDLEHMELIN